MTADRFKLQLYRRGVHLRRFDRLTNLDPADDAILRNWLEQLVEKREGTLQLDLSAGWELKVRIPYGRRVVARCWVTRSGLTVVKRP